MSTVTGPLLRLILTVAHVSKALSVLEHKTAIVSFLDIITNKRV